MARSYRRRNHRVPVRKSLLQGTLPENILQRVADIHRWALALRDSERPAYLAVADAIGDDIHTGRLAAAERLPPLRAVAGHLHLNYSTVARAYAEAERRGLIESRAGHGTFVRATTPPTGVGPSRASLVEMTMNFPPEPADTTLLGRMRDSLAELARTADPYDLLRYQEAGGTRADREAGVRWLGPQLPGVSPDRVLVVPACRVDSWRRCACSRVRGMSSAARR